MIISPNVSREKGFFSSFFKKERKKEEDKRKQKHMATHWNAPP
jgi:hypothetical protein